MSILEEFWESSHVKRENFEAIMEFLVLPENINKMIIASDAGLPAITFIVSELEDKFGDYEKAPLNHEGKNQNMTNRQNVGRMIKFVMAQYGYKPKFGKLDERARIPAFANSGYFSTGIVYEKREDGKYRIQVQVVDNS